LNVDRYPLPVDAPPGAADALAALPSSALYRSPTGTVSARPQLPEDANDRALGVLRARLVADGDLAPDMRAAVAHAVLELERAHSPASSTIAAEISLNGTTTSARPSSMTARGMP